MTTRLIHPAHLVAVLLIGSGAVFAATPLSRMLRRPPAPASDIAATAIQGQTGSNDTYIPPAPIQREINQRERFLNVLLPREERLIQNQSAYITRQARLGDALNRVEASFFAMGASDRRLQRLSFTLSSLLRQTRTLAAGNYSRMISGMNRNLVVLGQLYWLAPTSNGFRRDQRIYLFQAQQIASLGRGPLGRPPVSQTQPGPRLGD